MLQTLSLSELSNQELIYINGGADGSYIDPNSDAYKAGQAARQAVEDATLFWNILKLVFL